MLDVKAASKIASEYLQLLTPTADKIQLEEIEYTSDLDNWYVTLSFTLRGEDETNPFSFSNRKFKIFTINANNGDVTAMKIREFK